MIGLLEMLKSTDEPDEVAEVMVEAGASEPPLPIIKIAQDGGGFGKILPSGIPFVRILCSSLRQ